MKKYILKELDKSKVYDLRDLNEEQLEMIYKHLQKMDGNWEECCFNKFKDIFKHHKNKLIFHDCTWFASNSLFGNVVSALELFEEIPPITEVQVDCSNLNKEQIEKMVEIVEKNGYKIATAPSAMLVDGYFKYFKFLNKNNVWLVDGNNKNATTITYDQFLTYYGEEKDVNEIEVVYDVVEREKAEQVHFDEARDITCRGDKEIKIELPENIQECNEQFVRIYNNTSEPFKIEIQPGQTVEIRYLKDDSKQRQKN